LDVAGDRWAEPLAGLDLEAARVKRALDHLAVEPSIRQEGESVRADVRRGVDLAAQIIKRDLLLAHGDADDVAVADLGARGHGDPVPVIGHSSPIDHELATHLSSRPIPSACLGDHGGGDSCGDGTLWQGRRLSRESENGCVSPGVALGAGPSQSAGWGVGAWFGVAHGGRGTWVWLGSESWGSL